MTAQGGVVRGRTSDVAVPLTGTAATAAPRDRWYVLGVLTVVYALNIADRFSISTLLEPIRQELHLSDRGIAFLTGWALAMFYVTVGIPVAALADHANRRNILAVALALWSGMTALCGLAQNYLQLLLARFAVGIGEAGGTPPSTSMLADKFPPGRRPMALTIFALGASPGRVARLVCGGRGGAARRLAHGLSGSRHPGRDRRADRMAHGARATPRSARCPHGRRRAQHACLRRCASSRRNVRRFICSWAARSRPSGAGA